MIEVNNVTKKYGKFIAVDEINFTVKDGEVVGLLGPNGAGKSTTMNMITGFIEPSEGNIIVNGHDIVKEAKKAKKQIGYMPENVPLYSDLTVKEFVSYMAELKLIKKEQRKEQVKKVIEETGLTEVQNKLTKNLSRGYKQRVSMAGALVGDPEVLILDEPTVGLDPKQVIEIRNLIKNLGKKHTVIVSSHILSEISQICERVIIINKGKIVAVDTPENLEEKTKEQNVLYVTVEDKEEKMVSIKEEMPEIKEIKMVKDNEDGTKQYKIVSDASNDLRKSLFDALPKKQITIFELKKAEVSLEDAFIKLVEGNNQEESGKDSIENQTEETKQEKDQKQQAKEPKQEAEQKQQEELKQGKEQKQQIEEQKQKVEQKQQEENPSKEVKKNQKEEKNKEKIKKQEQIENKNEGGKK